MNNLTLGRRMLLLTVILMASLLIVAWASLSRLIAVNAQVESLVDGTIRKSNLANDVQRTFLSAIRGQKNSIMSPDDASSKEQAEFSRAEMNETLRKLDSLEVLMSAAAGSDQLSAVTALRKELEEWQELNDEALGLSEQNTNVKARALLAGTLHSQAELLAARFQGWTDQVLAKPAADQNDLSRLKSLNAGHSALLQLNPRVMLHIESSSPDEMSSHEKKLDALETEIAGSLEGVTAADPAGQAEARILLRDLSETVEKITQLSRQDTNNRSTTISLTTARVSAEKCMARLEELEKLLAAEADRGRAESLQVYVTARWWILGMSLAGLLIGGFMARVITQSVTGPVLALRDFAQKMAAGDLRHRITLKQTDEVGQLSSTTNALADALSRIVSQIQRVSEGLGGSADDLTAVSRQLLSQSQTASSQATSVATASEQMSASVSTMAAAAEEMSVNLSSISSASEEMSVSIGTISSAAEQTSTNVRAVSTAVTEISDSFADVMSSVQEGSKVAGEARSMADSATESIELLNQSGAEISKVTEAIKMIALQTNLLALNATIEATSAGEAGKGFAVVAHEIKELANQSGRAAEDIARKIEGVQNDTRRAVQVIQSVSQIINEINATSEKISRSVEKQTRAAGMISKNVSEASKGVGDIARSISEVAKAAGDMSRNVAEAARGANDVSRNVTEAASAAGGISASIHRVSEASRATNGSAENVHRSAEGLDRIGAELKKLVSRFRTNTDQSESA